MNKCFHGFDPENCMTCLSNKLRDEYWHQGLQPNSVPTSLGIQLKEKEKVMKEKKPKKDKSIRLKLVGDRFVKVKEGEIAIKETSSNLSRDEKIRITALNAEVNIKPKNIPPLYWAKIFEHYIRTGEISE